MNILRSQLIRIYGVVQGVGFRPFVSRVADRLGVCGSVANRGSYVEIHAQGKADTLDSFRSALEQEAPPRSSILKIDVRDIEEPPVSDFRIVESEKECGDIFVSPDIAVCPLCEKELYDPENRRYRHAFINCTACGPRLTILDRMPYDRIRTSMEEFPMCAQCEFEYTHAETRRYDAQPVCCNDCGPEVYLIGRAERGLAAITAARNAIIDGKIIAIKGIGGFHLCCNARSKEAVSRLRERKHRPMKPFAVMMRDLASVRKECRVLPEQEAVLTGHQKPIVLLEKLPQCTLPEELAPGNPTLGVMLAYAPVQLLLFRCDDELDERMPDTLVMTSGNVSGAPICRDDEDAQKEIAPFCDLMLSHNRKIRLRADDTVMDFFERKPYMIRRSRGYAPLPFLLSGAPKGTVLGIGGELKNSFCPGRDGWFYPSPYIGDMADVRTVDALRESIVRMETLLEMRPELVCCDLHPRYNTVAVAEELRLPLLRIQHHYAHILSCMAENDISEPVIGVSFDGTGYGTDGTIWGGEILRADTTSFERLGSIQPFLQVGGDASAREGWRIAGAMIHQLYPETGAKLSLALQLGTAQEFQMLSRMADLKLNSVSSTSAGRLFDAVSAILGIRKISTFEGEASMALEFAAENWRKHHPDSSALPEFELPAPFSGERFLLPTEALVRALVEARLAGRDVGELAFAFHRLLADGIAGGCVLARNRTRLERCALSGGVFQNRLLLELCVERLRKLHFQPLLHSLTPPNDGGIALGQAAAALWNLPKFLT